MKSQPTEWEKVFANDETDKGLLSKIFKQLIQLYNNNNNKTAQSKKWAKDLNRLFLKKLLRIITYFTQF